jgi:hypothetical protein
MEEVQMPPRSAGKSSAEHVSSISPTAFGRLLALHDMEVAAAIAMAADGGYSDFFVEGSGPPWHEAFGDSAVASLPAVAAVSEAARAGALLQLNVFQAYQRLKEQTAFRQ